MATHFARGILTEGHLVSVRLPTPCHFEVRNLPTHRRTRFLASRSLLAELMFMLYGTSTLPEIVTEAKGKPVFRDKNLPGFSISYAGNIVGVVLTTEGNSVETWRFSSNENLWINNQNDPNEARAQLITLRQSVLKLTGDVCNDDPRELQLLPGAGRLRCAHVTQIEAICDAEDVLVWSVAVTPTIEKLKVWEFDGKQDWKILPDIQTRANEPTGRLIRFSQLCAAKSHTL